MRDRRHSHPWKRKQDHHIPFSNHRRAWQPNKEKFVFNRFFGLMMSGLFLIVVGVILATIILNKLSGRTLVLIIVGTFLSVMILGVIPFIAREVKRITTPIVEVMSAADLVADGDFSIRVTEDYSGEFKKLAESFNRMVKELEEADARRRRLTADIAHELRTPLHILQGNLEGMQDGIYPMDETQLKRLLDEIRILSRLVDDLQTLTLAENQQLPLHLEDINLTVILQDVVRGFRGQAESLEIDLRLSPSPDDIHIHVDRDRLHQVLGNLIANALRFTPPGGKITLDSTQAEDKAIIRISDTGQGITKENLSYVFDRFWKEDASRAHRDDTGSGLGLSIAKGIIEMHHGEITVDSEWGEGTSFTITLPTVPHENAD